MIWVTNVSIGGCLWVKQTTNNMIYGFYWNTDCLNFVSEPKGLSDPQSIYPNQDSNMENPTKVNTMIHV